jgi:hypothetical protein
MLDLITFLVAHREMSFSAADANWFDRWLVSAGRKHANFADFPRS